MRRVWAGPLCLVLLASPALGAEPFRFEAEMTLDDMRSWVRRELPPESTREQVRAVFVGQGGATLKPHPRRADVEKYIYDINLCSYYVWRWNISADYSAGGKLKQLYVNGEPALGNAAPAARPTKGPFYKLARPRPEAFKGEASLAAIITDRDGDLKTADDEELLTGVGPTRVDPLDMGRAHAYSGEVWRSIFDFDDAKAIVPYAGDCAKVDAEMTRLTQKAVAAGTLPPSSIAANPPPPAALDDTSVRQWVATYVKADGWTLIGADGQAVAFGSPKGVARNQDGTLTTEIRHEYYRPVRLGPMDSRSNLQTWTVDCKGRRIKVQAMTIFEGANLSGTSLNKPVGDADWSPIADDSMRTRTFVRVCEAPTTGQRLK